MLLSITSLGQPLMARPTEQSLIADHHGVIYLSLPLAARKRSRAQQRPTDDATHAMQNIWHCNDENGRFGQDIQSFLLNLSCDLNHTYGRWSCESFDRDRTTLFSLI